MKDSKNVLITEKGCGRSVQATMTYSSFEVFFQFCCSFGRQLMHMTLGDICSNTNCFANFGIFDPEIVHFDLPNMQRLVIIWQNGSLLPATRYVISKFGTKKNNKTKK